MTPDLVGITNIAELVKRSRQNMRKLIHADDSNCPSPVYNGSSSLWHLYDILQWLKEKRAIKLTLNF